MDNVKYDLIRRSISNDKEAVIDLIKSEQNNIYSTLFYLNVDEDDIYDLMQDILIKLTKKINQLKNPLCFKSWLNHIVLNSYYDFLRKKGRLNNINLVSPDSLYSFDIPDNTTNPQEEILYSELDLIIKNSISNLPLHYKIPITLREIQGLSYEEISNIANISLGTVKSRISRARNILKKQIEKYSRS